MQPLVLLSGTSNEPLSRSVAKLLKKSLGNVEITRFMDNECRVWVREDVANKNVFIIQSLSMVADQHLVELCLIGQALKQLKASRVTAVIPWMGYSKQDKEFRKGEAVSAHLVAKFIEVAGFDAVLTVELHSESITPYFRIPMTRLSTHQLFSDVLRKKKIFGEVVVVSPDRGGKSRSEQFAGLVGLPIVYLDKKRDLETGKVTVVGASRDVKDLTIVIFDDIINTGATAIKTSEFLKSKGARKIYFLATHAILAGDASAKLQKSPIDDIVVTDTVLIPKEKQCNKLSTISVAPLVAHAISTIVR